MRSLRMNHDQAITQTLKRIFLFLRKNKSKKVIKSDNSSRGKDKKGNCRMMDGLSFVNDFI